VTPCSVVAIYQRFEGLNLHSEDGGSMALRNVDILPQHYTASQPRRPRRECFWGSCCLHLHSDEDLQQIESQILVILLKVTHVSKQGEPHSI
jgi:hypothetical protein